MALTVKKGSSDDDVTPEADWLGMFVAGTSPTRIGGHLKQLTSAAHIAGSPADEATARYVRDQFRAAGIADVAIESYSVLLSYPIHRS